MKICKAGGRTKEGATSSSYNRKRRGVEDQKNLEQVANKGKGQILSKIERIHSRIKYLRKKRELGKCKGGS